MNLKGGSPWNWMVENIYPDLRSSASIVCYIERTEDTPEIIPEIPEIIEEPAGKNTDIFVESILIPSEPETVEEPIEIILEESIVHPAENKTVVDKTSKAKYPIMALRSNLLLPLLNVGAEVPLAKHWSVGADYYYPWLWPNKDNKNCFELIFVSAEARYWFNPSNGQMLNRNYLIGHSVGIYGAWGYYDIEHNFKGHQGQGWSVGVDYLFALPIAKGKIHLEFEIALGAVWSNRSQPYTVHEIGGKLIKEKGITKNYSYIGPTKVGVSLVLPINRSVKPSAPVLP